MKVTRRHCSFKATLLAAAALLITALVSWAAPGAAQEVPLLPDAFYGQVYAGQYGGGVIQQGAEVAIYVGDETTPRAQPRAVTNGWYATENNCYLLQPIYAADVGKVLTFKVNGVPAKTYYNGVETTLKVHVNPANGVQEAYVARVDLVVPAPEVESTDPANGATGVPADKTITVTFKGAVQPGDKFADIALKDASGKAVEIDTSISERVLTIKPKAPLAGSTTYTVTIPTGAVKDAVAGILLAQEYTFSFTTEQDKTPPAVQGSDPAPGAKDVPVNKVITVTFSEAIQPGDNFAGIALRDDKGNAVQADVSVDSADERLLRIAPSALSYGTTYTVVVPSGAVKDVAGNALAQDYTFSFTTQAEPDTTPPAVASTDPANSATGVPVSKVINVTFSEDVQEGPAYGSISVKDAAGKAIDVTKSIAGKVLSIKPNASLAYNTKYTVTIPAGAVKDLAGNALAQDYAFSFTAQAAPVTPPGTGGGAPVPAPPADKVEKPIQAGATTVAEISGKVRVEVPAGAVTGANASIKAEVVGDEKASGAGMTLLSKVVDITLKDGTLTGKVTITLHFDKTKLGKDQEPAAFYYDEKQGKWVRLEGTVDADKGTVTVTVDHLTLFAVFAVAKEAEQPQVPPTKTFADIQGHWAQKDIEVMAGLGIAAGVAPDRFDPNGLVTRAEFAAFLIRSLGIAETKPAAASFKDVSPDAWYYGAVETARAAGLVGGYPDGTFKPNQRITREEIAAMVVRALAKAGKPVTVADPEALLSRFADQASISQWAREDAAKAVEAGIVTGREGNRFAPKENATRAEAVVMLKRMLVSLDRIAE